MRNPHPSYQPTKDIIKNKVFPELRNHGFLARMNFSCCASCASYELAQALKTSKKTRVVFYHRQTEETFKSQGYAYFYYFGEDDSNEGNDIVGGIITEISKKHGLKVEWNGSGNQAIKVTKE